MLVIQAEHDARIAFQPDPGGGLPDTACAPGAAVVTCAASAAGAAVGLNSVVHEVHI